MFIYIYDVVFGYIMFLFFDEHDDNFCIIKEVAENIRRLN